MLKFLHEDDDCIDNDGTVDEKTAKLNMQCI